MMRTLQITAIALLSIAGINSLGWAQEAPPKMQIRVQVTTPDGATLPGATVLVQDDEDYSVQTLVSDAQGNIETQVSPSHRTGIAHVFAYKVGYGFNSKRVLAGESTLALLPATTLSGRVVDVAGNPVAGVQVKANHAVVKGNWQTMAFPPDGDTPAELIVTTDAEGRFLLPNMPVGRTINIFCAHPKYVTARADINEGEATTLKLRPGATFKGRLEDEAGNGLAGVTINAQETGQHDNGWGKTVTDQKGEFTISGLENGTYNVIASYRADSPVVAAAHENVLATEGNETLLPPMRAVPGVVITGQVRDAVSGKPLPKAQVGLYGPKTPRSGAAMTPVKVDANGEYKVRTLPGLNYLYIFSEPEGYLNLQQSGQEIEVTDKPAVVNFELQPAPRLRGVVVDLAGKPVKPDMAAAIAMNINHQRIQINADATFEYLVSRSGPVNLRGAIKDGVMWDVVAPSSVEPPFDRPVRVTVLRIQPHRLEGRVVTADDKPVPGVEVKVELTVRRDDFGDNDTRETVTDAEGRYTITDIRPNHSLSIEVQKTGFSVVRAAEVKREGDLRQATDFVLEALNTTVSGRVVGPDGAPAAGVPVFALGREAITGADGSYTLNGLPPRPVEVVAGQGKAFAMGTTVNSRLELKLAPATLQPTDAALAEEILAETLEDAALNPRLAPFEASIRARQTRRSTNFEQALEGVLAQPEDRRDNLLFSLAGRVAREVTKLPEPGAGESTLRRILNAIQSPELKLLTLLVIEENFPEPKFAAEAWLEAKALYPEVQGQVFTEERKYWHQNALVNFAPAAERREGAQAGIRALNIFIAYVLKHYPEKRANQNDYRTSTSSDILRSYVKSMAEVSLPLFQHLLGTLDRDSGNYAYALSEAIPALVKQHGIETARPLLTELVAMKDPAEPGIFANEKPQYAFGQAVQHVIPLLGPNAGREALALARQVKQRPEDHSRNEASRALALAARLLPVEEAAPVFRQAIVDASPNLAARMAYWAFLKDEKLGRELFEIARTKLPDAEDKNTFQGINDIAVFAFYYAPAEPAQSRLLLEKCWSLATVRKDAQEQHDVARAMARLDGRRAVEMARQMKETDSRMSVFARQSIASWVALEEGRRSDWPLMRQDGKDNWVISTQDW